MTRPRGGRRKRSTVEWTDEQGTAYSDARPVVRPIPAVAQVPRRKRLANITCPDGHLFAVVERPTGVTPALVHVDGSPLVGVGVMALVVDGRLGAAMTNFEAGTIGVLGTPRDSLPITCRDCNADFILVASEIPTDPVANTVEIAVRPA